MTTIDTLTGRVRTELGDQPVPFFVNFRGDGIRRHFELGHAPLELDSVRVFVGGTELLPTDFTVDVAGAVTLNVAPGVGALVEVSGRSFPFFADAAWAVFVETAFRKHTHDRAGLLLADLPAVEEPLVVTLAAVEGLWALASAASFDIDIHAPQEMDVPRSQRYAQIRRQIEALMDRYERECAALGVGFRAPRNVKRKRTK